MKTKHTAYPHPKKHSADAPEGAALFVRHAATSLSMTLAVGAGFLVVLSLAAYLTPDPDSLTAPLGLCAAAMTSFLGGVISTRVHRRRAPLPAAMINAALLSLLMLVLSLCFVPLSSGYSALVSALLHAAVFLLSAFGAMVSMREKQPKRRRR